MIFSQETTRLFKGVIVSIIFGGGLGAATGFLYMTGTLDIPGLSYIFTASPVDTVITGAMLGIFIGIVINSLFRLYIASCKTPEYGLNVNNLKLKLREEQLDISKQWVKTGEVTIHKEILREEKNITVPVTREELVIEKKIPNSGTPGKATGHKEVIRIPVREEHIEVIKHPVALEDVEIYKRQFQEIQHVEETLKKEKVRAKIIGNPEVIGKETEDK